MNLLTPIDADQQHLVPPLPDEEKTPPILRLIHSRDSFINHQIRKTPNETVATKKCACQNCGGTGWVLCERTGTTSITYRTYAYWGTDLTNNINETSLLVYEMTAEIPADCDLKLNATHINYITVSREGTTIFMPDHSLFFERKAA